MILGIGDTEIDLSESLQITAEEYAEWQIQIDRIAVPSCILGLISKIRGCLKQPIGNENDGASKPIFVSDRRWKKLSGYCGRQPFSMDAIKLNELIVY